MKKIMYAIVCMALFASCKKSDSSFNNGSDSTLETTIAPDGFNFNTTKQVSLSARLLTNDNKPLSNVMVNVYSTSDTKSPIYTALSDANGNISAQLTIPAYADSLVIDPAYIGLMRNAIALIKGNNINCVIGGSDGYSGDIVPNDIGIGDMAMQSTFVISNGEQGALGSPQYKYINTYDNTGRPNNLVTPSDVISAELLSFINASLPEQKPVPTYHPDFLSNDAATDLNIEKNSDVWVTFVSEGAGYYNSLGFYTYPTNKPPQTQTDIDTIRIAIPNASLVGSGGSMRSGDKIYLGRYPAGTSIGFVLFQNAWNGGSRAVNTSATKFFGNDILNNEKTGFKRHTVLLYDDKNSLFMEGFEDLQRDNNSSDNDFNDLIFYTTSNPVDAISRDNVMPIDKPIDSDGDGVTDIYDKFPKDPTKAYIQYFPSQNGWGTLAFEDLWPNVGDYDLNDLVVGYQYAFINNALNKTVEIDASYTIRAVGASIKSGFGIQFPFTPDKVKSVEGQLLTGGYIKQSANGTEASQTKTVIVPFDDQANLLKPGLFVNTSDGQSYVSGDTANIKISLSTALTAAELGTGPFNPFLIVNQQRGKEVHLPGNKPTDLADSKLFGSADDRTSSSKNKYYLSDKNWPWALSFVEDFSYPVEGNNISKAYSFFLKWAESGGSVYADWYRDNSGYRNQPLIYKRK